MRSCHVAVLVLLAMSISGCASLNGPCGPLALNGDLAATKLSNGSGQCVQEYTLFNLSNRMFRPLISVRFLDPQGDTVGQELVMFDAIDPGRSQTKRGRIFSCSYNKTQVLNSEYIYGRQAICGVSGKTFSW